MKFNPTEILRAMSTDSLHRFLLETPNVKGSWTQLSDTWRQLLERADYPISIQQLLGEALTAITLLSTTIKQTGSIILQIRGDGPVRLLVVQIQTNGAVRGLVRWNTIPNESATLQALVGQGHVAITINAEQEHERYQGIIALEGETLAQALENYFQQSEQLPTRLFLATNATHCAGILLQRLPTQDLEDEGWKRANLLLNTLTADELLNLDAENLLYRLFHEEKVRLFDAKPIFFKCSCDRERIAHLLISLGEAEVDAILAEQGQAEVTCEFCNACYQFDAIDAKQLFLRPLATANHNHTLH